MKIAFIVESNWLQTHFGVRNYFTTCAQILKDYDHDVHFIFFLQNMNKVYFYRTIIGEYELQNIIKKTLKVGGEKYNELILRSSNKITFYEQFIGDDISEDYDAFIVTNPWLLNYPLKIKNNKPISLICHDCGANMLALLNKASGFGWGFAHNVGYKFALSNNYHFLSNSLKTDCEIQKFYNPKKHSFLPPVPTYKFLENNYAENQVKENAIILAAPFDLRKGLAVMPNILNELSDDFDTLYIYGTPRCGAKAYNKFFDEINVKDIVFYDKITTDDLIQLYNKTKILLFPSREEGLGIPILEAQLAGCRVVTTDERPMNQLLCHGGYLLGKNLEIDIKNIKQMLHDENFDYCLLNAISKEKFSKLEIYKSIMKSFE